MTIRGKRVRPRIIRITLALGALLYAASFPTEAQHDAKVYRIGVLETVGAASNVANLSAFRQGLGELGYVEGQNLVIEYRSADGRAERFSDLASELLRLKIDVILTRGTAAALSAKHATGTIPIVMASSGEPAAEGIVTSLARPGGNVTGFHIIAPAELGGRRLQLLKETVPGVSRVGILWSPADIQTPQIVRETERAARAMGVQLRSLELHGREGLATFDQAFEAALMGQVDALVAVEDTLTFTYRARIKGARPADLPVEAPIKFELAINLKTAKALGLTIPPSLLQRADYLVQ